MKLMWKKDDEGNHLSHDGNFRISKTNYHPNYRNAHDSGENATFWMVSKKDKKLGTAPDYWVNHRSHFSLKAAKEASEKHASRMDEALKPVWSRSHDQIKSIVWKNSPVAPKKRQKDPRPADFRRTDKGFREDWIPEDGQPLNQGSGAKASVGSGPLQPRDPVFKSKKLKRLKDLRKTRFGNITLNKQTKIVREEADDQHIYHVTHTKHVAKIQKHGILPMKTSNWVKAGDKDRYGGGEIYAFTHKDDAEQWAGRMEWAHHQTLGSGKISIIIAKRPHDREFETDHSDPLSQAGRKGDWIKTKGFIAPHHIVSIEPYKPRRLGEDVKFIPIKDDEDSAHEIIGSDGKRIGTLSRGWLRRGGKQWVVNMPNKSPKGYASLKHVKQAIKEGFVKYPGKPFDEDVANSVGGGNIAGMPTADPPEMTPVRKAPLLRRKKFAGKEVFVVDPNTFYKAWWGKKKYEHYEKYLEDCVGGEEIREFGRKYWDQPIIIENEQTGAMVYLKYGSK